MYPSSGSPQRLWHVIPAVDRVARSAASVCALYSEVLQEQVSIDCPWSRVWIHLTWDREGGEAAVLPRYRTELGRKVFGGVIQVRGDLDGIPCLELRGMILGAVHEVMTAMATRLSLSIAPFETVRDHVEGVPDLVFRWNSPWKASPDRKLRARARYVADEDGFGRSTVEFVNVDGLRVESSPIRAPVWVEDYQRSARTLSWFTGSCVVFSPYAVRRIGFIGEPQFICVSREDGSLQLDEAPEPDYPDPV